MGDRPRWMPAPIGSPDAQDTDPDDAVTEMAMHEISDTRKAASMERCPMTIQFQVRHTTNLRPPLSTVEQYKSAGRIDDAITFSMSALFVTAIVCLSIGILVGFIAGFLDGEIILNSPGVTRLVLTQHRRDLCLYSA